MAPRGCFISIAIFKKKERFEDLKKKKKKQERRPRHHERKDRGERFARREAAAPRAAAGGERREPTFAGASVQAPGRAPLQTPYLARSRQLLPRA